MINDVYHVGRIGVGAAVKEELDDFEVALVAGDVEGGSATLHNNNE
jgi:hypothetical protein